MKFTDFTPCKQRLLLVGGGALAGILGWKLLTSDTAKQVYVQGIACGIRAKNAYKDVVETAKAEVDDMVSEATYMATDDDIDFDEAELEDVEDVDADDDQKEDKED